MNKSVRENCVPKCIVVSLEKNLKKVDYRNTPLIPSIVEKGRKRAEARKKRRNDGMRSR